MASIISASTTSGTALNMSADTTGILQLATGATPTTAVTIDTSQNVGIGTTSPADKLQVNGSSNTSSAIRLTNQNTNVGYISNYASFIGSGASNDFTLSAIGALNMVLATNGAERMRIDTSGNVLIAGTTANVGAGTGFKFINNGVDPYCGVVVTNSTGSVNNYHLYALNASAYRFYVSSAGTINATNTSITGISDISLKENIRDLETGLAEVMALRPRRFDWKEETKLPEKNNAGFIAQEVEQVLPELVYDYQYDTNVIKKSLKMGDMLPTLVKAIQEQQTIINDLKARIETLEAK